MEILIESEISKFIDHYDNLLSNLSQMAEFSTYDLNDIFDPLQNFYKESRELTSRLPDLLSMPLEELRVKKMLLGRWLKMANDRTHMPNSHFAIIQQLAIDENKGILPPSYADAGRKQGKMETYYHVAYGVRWYYNNFVAALESTLNFINEATKPYQNPKSLGQIQKQYDTEMEDKLKEYLTTAEAAALMKTSTKTIFRRIESGQLKATRNGNSQYRIRRLDVELWLAGHS